jgi:hypothetical protein
MAVSGEAWVARDGACCNLSLKIAAKLRGPLRCHPRRWRRELLDEDFGRRPSCLWMPSVTGRWMIIVAFDNCGERIRDYPRCGRWPLLRCIHFDTGNDAWRDQVNIHADREEPKFSACLAFRVRRCCILAERTLSCCSPPTHGNARRQRAEDTAEMSAGDSTLFPLVARVCTTSAFGKEGSTEEIPATKCSLKVRMARSTALRR